MRTLVRSLAVITAGVALIGVIGLSSAFAAIDIVAATPELADIAKQVGGEKVSVVGGGRAGKRRQPRRPRAAAGCDAGFRVDAHRVAAQPARH